MKPLRLVMSSQELARVVEIPQRRRFEVTNDDGRVSVVTFDPANDSLYCFRHGDHDDCTCSARIRLCGVLTNTVAPDVLTRPKLETK